MKIYSFYNWVSQKTKQKYYYTMSFKFEKDTPGVQVK